MLTLLPVFINIGSNTSNLGQSQKIWNLKWYKIAPYPTVKWDHSQGLIDTALWIIETCSASLERSKTPQYQFISHSSIFKIVTLFPQCSVYHMYCKAYLSFFSTVNQANNSDEPWRNDLSSTS